MVYGYIRVSTSNQTLLNQKYEINNFATKKRLKITSWIEETISGTKDYQNRKLGKLLRKCKKGDLIICTELSRLGRNVFMIMQILSMCMKKGCKVWTIKDHYRLGNDVQSKVLAFAFGLSAEIERNLLSSRTKEALERKREEGKHLGRRSGSKNALHALSGREKEIARMLSQGVKKQRIAVAMHVSRSTIMRYVKELETERKKSRRG